jgi:protein-tyrosine phosphatase
LYNIKAVITIETAPKPQYILNYYRFNNIDFTYFYLPDHPDYNITQYFNDSYDFIHKHLKKGENVLVHCRMGISRSSTLVINYMLRELYSMRKIEYPDYCILNSVLEYTRSKRPVVNPNQGFLDQLYLRCHEYRLLY